VEEIKNTLMHLAIEMYGEIIPCPNKETFEKSFTIHEGKIIFWFNTKDGSTHVLSSTQVGQRGQSS
jgi:hypothetical protein